MIAGSRMSDPAQLEDLSREIAAFTDGGGRVVAITQAQLPVDTVVIENRAGARALAGELAGLGYERLAVLTGPPTW